MTAPTPAHTGQVPQRVLSALTWAAVTLLATGIGLLAISTVGEVLRGSGPLGEDFSIAQQRGDVPDAPVTLRQHTHTHPLATLTTQCAGRTATLLAAQPVPGATVVDIDLGPDEDVHVDIDTDGTTTRLEIYCNHGEPRLIIEPRS